MAKEKHTFYNFQFKYTAVKVSNHPGIQGKDVAEALNIHPIMLYRWKKDMKDGKIQDNEERARSIAVLEEAEKRIQKLVEENKRLREENIILKKAERLFPVKKKK